MSGGDPFPLIEIEGTPFERGYSYGRQAGDRIARGIVTYGEAIAKRRDLEATIARFLADLANLDEDLVDEVRGIAAGADQPIASIVALNARTELTAWDAQPSTEECTAGLALPSRTSDGSLIHAQNWDWRPECVDTAIVLRIRAQKGPDILTFCEAGQLARHGLNSAGVAITANGLQTRADISHSGLPSPFARRRTLMAESLGEAIGVLLNTPRTSSHNIIASQIDARGRAEAVNLELTPDKAFWSLPSQGVLTHGNHFKHPQAVARLADVGLLRHPESLYRDWRLQQHLDGAGSAISLDTFKVALADDFGAPHSICRPPTARSDGSISATVASLIMSVASTDMWIARSPYSGAACYQRYSLSQ